MKNLLLFLFAILPLFLFAQENPYQLSFSKDATLITGGLTLLVTDFLLSEGIEPLTQGEIDGLNADDINSFDRFATTNFSTTAATRSDVGLLLGTGLGLATPFVQPLIAKDDPYGKALGTLSVMWLETNFWNLGGTDIVKLAFLRTRPFVYNTSAPNDIKLEVDARKAFFSGHTSIAAANMFFAAKVFHDYHPDSKARPYVWAVAALVPLWTGIERINAGKHFPTDVIAGYAWGAFCGWAIPHLHKKKGKDHGMSWQVAPYSGWTDSGLRLSLAF
ncbi:MAG: phosphatase PAP2 family protein [Bacteroidota bacterium]